MERVKYFKLPSHQTVLRASAIPAERRRNPFLPGSVKSWEVCGQGSVCILSQAGAESPAYPCEFPNSKARTQGTLVPTFSSRSQADSRTRCHFSKDKRTDRRLTKHIPSRLPGSVTSLVLPSADRVWAAATPDLPLLPACRHAGAKRGC